MSWITSTTPRDHALYFKVLQPAPQLRNWVRYYWVLKDEARGPQVDEFLAPDGFEEIIFSYADGFRRTEILGSEVRQNVLEQSYVVGCKPYGVTCSRTGRLAMIGVKLWPHVLHTFLRVPLHDLSGRPLLLSDINSRVLNELEARLFDVDSEEQIRNTLNTMLHVARRESSDILSHSIRQLFGSHGAVRIGELVAHSGVHYRTLEKAFRERVGLPPKTLAKIVRFKHAFESLSRGAPGERSSVTDFGYYDQAHFCREFKLFTGRTPTQFFRDRLSIDVAKFCLGLDLQTLNHRAASAEFLL